ncbi:MAG: hypothetical protein ACOC7V_04900 [Spirochaetota bacterium]
MKTIAGLLFLLIPALALPATPLWERAVELYGSYDDLVPGRMEIRFDQYNGRDKLVTTEESVIDIWVDEDGQVQSRIVRATKDGDDVTEERRENPRSGAPPFGGGPGDEEEEDDGGAFSGLERSPFDPLEQTNVRIVDVGPTAIVDGVAAQPFEYEHETGPDSITRGTAWLSVGTGEPIRLHATIEPLPSFVRDFALRQHFDRDREGRLVVRELEFDGVGRILFLERRIESRLIFSDYFRSD